MGKELVVHFKLTNKSVKFASCIYCYKAFYLGFRTFHKYFRQKQYIKGRRLIISSWSWSFEPMVNPTVIPIL